MPEADPGGPWQGQPSPAHGGLESAVAAGRDEPAGQALSRLRQAGASLVVTVDADGRPQTVVPEKPWRLPGPGGKWPPASPHGPPRPLYSPHPPRTPGAWPAITRASPFWDTGPSWWKTGRSPG
jgi:hypothetical protein